MASFVQLNAQAAALTPAKYVVMGKDGQPRFFEILFVNGGNRVFQLIGSPVNYTRHTMKVSWQAYVLHVITNSPSTAIALYGKYAKTCGACDSPLTHARSRACGMGPKCAPRWGVKW